MFFFISKILSYLLSPLFWVMLLLLLGIIARNRKKAMRRLVVGLALLYLFSNHFLVSEVMRIWEVPVTDTPATYRAGIVLGGNILNYDRENKREIFRDNPDRLFQAIRLYKQGKINKIIISGGPGHIMYPDEYEAAYAGRYLSSIGIPEEDILVDSLSVNTRENAVNTAEIINHYELSGTFLLITSSYHMRRASGCFHKAGIDIETYPVGKIAGPRKYNIDHLLVPHVRSLVYWDILIHEMAGYVAYKLAGYV